MLMMFVKSFDLLKPFRLIKLQCSQYEIPNMHADTLLFLNLVCSTNRYKT